MYMYIYIYIYIYIERERDTCPGRAFRRDAPASRRLHALPLLSCDVYTNTPAPKQVYKLHTAHICLIRMFYKLSWPWAWV